MMHDGILVEAPDSERDAVEALVRAELGRTRIVNGFRFAFEAKVTSGQRWSEIG